MAVVGCAVFVYQAMLKRASRLIPKGVSVCLLAERGFGDPQLMRYWRDDLHWHFRIPLKSNSWIYRVGKGGKQLNQYHLALGEVLLLHCVTLTKTPALNGLDLAVARDSLTQQMWMVVSAQPTTLQTFREYGERFQIEEQLLDCSTKSLIAFN
ncbi:hypothetical protein [Chroococcidiopsis sp. CCMEE 29]|uniref:hypothetical protein n=1 Tax=Chroococcidiopsis sp. CCMEE 29 TaxID=155894 RepID=UPI00201FF7F7|nr:hypothetical protein [Chroococcidiopsis sp. CCMEE 29]